MKKWIIAGVITVTVILIALSVFLLTQFIDIAGKVTPEATADPAAVEDYARTHLADFDCTYDGTTLILSQTTGLTSEAARSYGRNIYADELAPETYLPQVRSICADIISNCQLSALEVELRYLSTDGEVIFSVSSSGQIQTCWEDPQ